MSERNVLVLIAATVTLAGAQPARPDPKALTAELNSMCRQVEQTEQAEVAILQAHKSAAVNSALTSEADFWQFLISPSTDYRDRMVAARLGGGLIGLDRLTELWKAQADLDRPRVPRVLSPCDYVMSANIRPENWLTRHNAFVNGASRPQSRLFLGQDLTKPFDYPVTQDERDHAPWLWQMERMMPVLVNAVETYYAQPGRYPAMAEVAWNWQTSDWWEASVRERALVRGPRNAAWLQNLIRLALERQSETGAGAVSSLYVFGSDSDHFEELVHVAQIIIMQRTRSRRVAEAAGFAIAQLATTTYEKLGPNCPLAAADAHRNPGNRAMGAERRDRRMEPLYRLCRRYLQDCAGPSIRPRSKRVRADRQNCRQFGRVRGVVFQTAPAARRGCRRGARSLTGSRGGVARNHRVGRWPRC